MTRKELTNQLFTKQSYLCIGLDTDIEKLPHHLRSHPDSIFEFNRQIIDATKDLCISYKINTAFYEALGIKGWEALEKTVAYIPGTHFKIADAKRGDIGNTAAQYAKAFFETLPFDAITVAPYMGSDSVLPFLTYKNKWTILLGLTSNAGAQDFEWQPAGEGLLYETVIKKAVQWGTPDNLMLVVGATQHDAFTNIRRLAPDHFYLVPGVGAQGGSLSDISRLALTKEGGLLVNVSRGIIYASAGADFDEKAREAALAYQSEMQHYLSQLSLPIS